MDEFAGTLHVGTLLVKDEFADVKVIHSFSYRPDVPTDLRPRLTTNSRTFTPNKRGAEGVAC
jgi:hypothetical protein